MERSKKGSVCCKKLSGRRTANPSKSNQEEIISLLKRIQISISKGRSRGVEEEENRNEFSENKLLTNAILEVLDKSRNNTEGDTSVKEGQPNRQVKPTLPPPSFTKRTPIPSARELKEVAKKRGIKGYSKLKKNELKERLRSS